jgi:hypothetical protein
MCRSGAPTMLSIRRPSTGARSTVSTIDSPRSSCDRRSIRPGSAIASAASNAISIGAVVHNTRGNTCLRKQERDRDQHHDRKSRRPPSLTPDPRNVHVSPCHVGAMSEATQQGTDSPIVAACLLSRACNRKPEQIVRSGAATLRHGRDHRCYLSRGERRGLGGTENPKKSVYQSGIGRSSF